MKLQIIFTVLCIMINVECWPRCPGHYYDQLPDNLMVLCSYDNCTQTIFATGFAVLCHQGDKNKVAYVKKDFTNRGYLTVIKSRISANSLRVYARSIEISDKWELLKDFDNLENSILMETWQIECVQREEKLASGILARKSNGIISFENLKPYTRYHLKLQGDKIFSFDTAMSLPFENYEKAIILKCTRESCTIKTLLDCKYHNGYDTWLELRINEQGVSMPLYSKKQNLDSSSYEIPFNIIFPNRLLKDYKREYKRYIAQIKFYNYNGTNNNFQPVIIKERPYPMDAFSAMLGADRYICWKNTSSLKKDFISYSIGFTKGDDAQSVHWVTLNPDMDILRIPSDEPIYCYQCNEIEDYGTYKVYGNIYNDTEFYKENLTDNNSQKNTYPYIPKITSLEYDQHSDEVKMELFEYSKMGANCIFNEQIFKNSKFKFQFPLNHAKYLESIIECSNAFSLKIRLNFNNEWIPLEENERNNLILSDSTFHFKIPKWERNSTSLKDDSIRSVYILVEDIGYEKKNLVDDVTLQDVKENFSSFKETFKGNKTCGRRVYIAAKLSQADFSTEFKLGDGNSYDEYMNCPIKDIQRINVYLMYEDDLYGMLFLHLYEMPLPELIRILRKKEFQFQIILIILGHIGALILACSLLALLYYKLKQKTNSTDLPRMNQLMFRRNVDLSNATGSLVALTSAFDTPYVESEYEGVINPVFDEEGPHIYETVDNRPLRKDSVQKNEFNLERFVNYYIKSNQYSIEFEDVPKTMKKTTKIAKLNSTKNYYKYAVPYDNNRVVLRRKSHIDGSDYINASYIKGNTLNKNYIAAQGPKNEIDSKSDFLQMIVSEDVKFIIQIDHSKEDDKINIGKYIPESENCRLNIGEYVVTLKEKEEYMDYDISKIQINMKAFVKNILHFHFTNWEEFETPSTTKNITSMMKRFYNIFEMGTVLVHGCSGSGRTGTILHNLLLHEQYTLDGEINPKAALFRLRDYRPYLVDDAKQYQFSIQILDEIFNGDRYTVNLAEFSLDSKETQNNLTKQYHMIEQIQQDTSPILDISMNKPEIPITTTSNVYVFSYSKEEKCEDIWDQIFQHNIRCVIDINQNLMKDVDKKGRKIKGENIINRDLISYNLDLVNGKESFSLDLIQIKDIDDHFIFDLKKVLKPWHFEGNICVLQSKETEPYVCFIIVLLQTFWKVLTLGSINIYREIMKVQQYHYQLKITKDLYVMLHEAAVDFFKEH